MALEQLIHVRRHGHRGDEVVVLHGGPGAPGSVHDLAQALAAERRVLEPWQRRAGTMPLTVEQHVADLAAVAPPRAVIVGHSAGAMWGLSYAARHPDRVRALVLVGCGTYDERCRALYRERMDHALGAAGRMRADALRRHLTLAPEGPPRDAVLGELGALLDGAMDVEATPQPDDPDAPPVDAVGHAATWADHLRLQAEGIEPQAFGAIPCPVAMLHGEDDPHPGEATRDLLRATIPRLTYEAFPHCGHTPWRERRARDAFFTALAGHLAIAPR